MDSNNLYEIYNKYKSYLPYVPITYPGLVHFWQLHIFVFFLGFVVMFPLISIKLSSDISEKINQQIQDYKKQLLNIKTMIKALKTQTTDQSEQNNQLKIIKEQGEMLQQQIDLMENIEYFTTFGGFLFIFFSAISQAIRQGILPQAASSVITPTNRAFDDMAISYYLSILKNIDPDNYDKYLHYFRSTYLLNQSTRLILLGLTNIATHAYNQKIDELKQIMFDSFLGEILNQYKLVSRPLNFTRFYQSSRALKRLVFSINTYFKTAKQKKKFQHLLFMGERENLLYFVFGLQELIPFIKIENIDFFRQADNLFKQFATEARKSHLQATLVSPSWKFIAKQDAISQVVMSIMKIFEFVLTSKDAQLTMHILSASGINRNEDIASYMQTIEYLNLLPNKSSDNILIFFSENTVTDEALNDRCECKFAFYNLSIEEFYRFLRQEALEYMALNGWIISTSEKTELGLCLYIIAQKVFPKMQHFSLNFQHKVLSNIFDFMRNNVNKMTFEEVIHALS